MRRTLQKPALYSLIAGPIIFGLPLAGFHGQQAPAAPEAAAKQADKPAEKPAEKPTLVYKALAGQSARYKTTGTLAMEAAGNKVNIEMTQVEKVSFTAVSPSGDITMERETESSEQTVNGQKMPSDDDDKTTLIFGNGEQGARLPTGLANVTSVYRNGIGKPGNVKAEQISLLQTRPLGVKGVINPLPASGGADKENRDQARENVPLAVMSLDRLVSVQDYADFARTFAGIGKASARKLSDGRRRLVSITIAGADDIPIDANSDLYRNLLIALRKFGDPDLPVQLQLRELMVLVLSANVRIAPDYQWDVVAPKVRATLLDVFGFQKRALGQPALLSEVISAIQKIEGVQYVDVDAFGGVPEKKPEADDNGKPTGGRTLLTLDEIAATVQQIVNPRQNSLATRFSRRAESVPAARVDVNLADFEAGALRPAQLAIFTEAVPDTLILNQIP